ncbi:hypothetical protein [Micromonospora sp. NPDC047134]|uniref:hypothetical protein n=1 Tax=Micromonospora sp. NPDC047134 TaxID=3154340 RepID=UPI0033C99750
MAFRVPGEGGDHLLADVVCFQIKVGLTGFTVARKGVVGRESGEQDGRFVVYAVAGGLLDRRGEVRTCPGARNLLSFARALSLVVSRSRSALAMPCSTARTREASL